MRLILKELKLPPPRVLEYLRGDEYVEIPACPICKLSYSHVAARSVAQDHIGIEVHVCRICEHIYLGRRPNNTWFSNMYENDIYAGRADQNFSIRHSFREHLRSLPIISKISEIRFMKAYGRAPIIQAMLQGIATNSSPGGLKKREDVRKVLEIGCGLGNNLKVFQLLGLETFGVEASPWRANYCRKHGHRVSAIPIDNLGEIMQFGPFDMIASSHVLEHVLNLDLFLNQLTKVLRPEGYLYLEVPNFNSEHFFHRLHCPAHVHVFTLKSLSKLLKLHGFTVIRIHQDFDTHIVAVFTKNLSEAYLSCDTLDINCLYRGLNNIQFAKEEDVRYEYSDHVTLLSREKDIKNPNKENHFFQHPFPFSSNTPKTLISAQMKICDNTSPNILEIEHLTSSPPLI